MATTTAELVSYEDPVVITERVAIAGFLAGYTGNTRTSYTTDLRIFAEWCHGQPPDAAGGAASASGVVRPLDGERGPDALHRRPPPVDVGQLLPLLPRRRHPRRDPAANVRRPKVDHESRTLGLDRNELGALLVQAGLGRLATTRWSRCWR